ncbi:HAD-IIIC family phosphatase [Sediminicola arcticus]|jgi:FkbH-like protein|uniref:HAD-IIIC family phosphatase n=1 Tax=Sediminicola arcticus TaxID=1574308 RepID=A0ABV2SWA8_9FLAO
MHKDILNYNELKKLVKNKIPEDGKKTSICIMGNHSIQFYTNFLTAYLKINDFNPDILEANYDQIDVTILDSSSKLYSKSYDIVIIFESSLKLRDNFYELKDNSERNLFCADKVTNIKNRIHSLRENGQTSKILYFSYELMDDHIYGNFFSKINHSFYYQLLQLNSELLKLAQTESNFFVIDINKYLLQSLDYRDMSIYINADVHYNLPTLSNLAKQTASFISALYGNFKKCLILDLDNTLWGGIIGDDGMDRIQIGSLGIGKAFTNLQKWAKELKNRGIILAVCSKNNEEIAKEPFEKHPEMVLSLNDISIFVANWENKADNIRYIQNVLDIGFDSMVFLDDNPAEREIIRQNLPEVTVPELPSDPANYLPYLYNLNLFDTASFSENDKDRTKQYQQEAKRKKLSFKISNMEDYLSSLEMKGSCTSFDVKDISRIAQLTQRSNQFNLRTKRYTEDDIRNFINSNQHLTYAIKLKDKFGDYGLISLVILEKKKDKSYFIDTWIMSCRVLKRGVEAFVINKIIDDLAKEKTTLLTGEYIPSKKNSLVANLLEELGLEEQSTNMFSGKINTLKTLKHYIK